MAADLRDVLIAPVVSEKSYGLLEENVYTFTVAPDASKPEIKKAVEEIFEVTVLKVNTLNRKGCLLYTSPSPRDRTRSRMPSSA